MVVGECSGGGVWWSGMVLCEINYWIITEIEVPKISNKNLSSYFTVSQCFAIYDKVIECIQLINCCIT